MAYCEGHIVVLVVLNTVCEHLFCLTFTDDNRRLGQVYYRVRTSFCLYPSVEFIHGLYLNLLKRGQKVVTVLFVAELQHVHAIDVVENYTVVLKFCELLLSVCRYAKIKKHRVLRSEVQAVVNFVCVVVSDLLL